MKKEDVKSEEKLFPSPYVGNRPILINIGTLSIKLKQEGEKIVPRRWEREVPKRRAMKESGMRVARRAAEELNRMKEAKITKKSKRKTNTPTTHNKLKAFTTSGTFSTRFASITS